LPTEFTPHRKLAGVKTEEGSILGNIGIGNFFGGNS